MLELAETTFVKVEDEMTESVISEFVMSENVTVLLLIFEFPSIVDVETELSVIVESTMVESKTVEVETVEFVMTE